MEIVLIVLSLLVIVAVAVMWYFTKKTFARGSSFYNIEKVLEGQGGYLTRIREGRASLSELPFEEVVTTSHDGLKLYGQLYRAEKDEGRYLICMHGYHSSPTDFMCAVGFFLEQGYHVLLVHQRTHGKSDGKWITFGIKERYDCLDWCHYLLDTYGHNIRIVLDGLSMGATTVLMATALDLPKNVVGVMADCGFTSPWDIVCHVAKTSMHIPKFPLLYLMRPFVRLTAGFDLKETSTVDAVRQTSLPLLFTHGLADDFVPHEMSMRAYNAAASEKRIVSVEGAGHGLSYIVDEAACQAACKEFLHNAATRPIDLS